MQLVGIQVLAMQLVEIQVLATQLVGIQILATQLVGIQVLATQLIGIQVPAMQLVQLCRRTHFAAELHVHISVLVPRVFSDFTKLRSSLLSTYASD